MAVAEKDDRRLHQLNLFLQLLPALVRRFVARLLQAESRSRNAARCVATPTKVAKNNVPLRPSRREPQLNVAVDLCPLHKRIAEKGHAVAVFELERRELARGGQ